MQRKSYENKNCFVAFRIKRGQNDLMYKNVKMT